MDWVLYNRFTELEAKVEGLETIIDIMTETIQAMHGTDKFIGEAVVMLPNELPKKEKR